MRRRGNATSLRGADNGSRAGDFVKVDCAACHHVALLTPEVLLRGGLSPGAKVLDLKGRGRAVVFDQVEGQGVKLL